jgi:glycosyltransferase involved in cell wall biosynthesis
VRIGILTQYYPPEIGAPQGRLSELAEFLARAGHEVRVLTAMPNYPAGRIQPGYGGVYRRETRGGVAVIRTAIYPTKSPRLLPRLSNYLSFVLSSSIVGGFVLRGLDVLLVESPPLFLGAAGVFLSRLCGARLIFNVSDLWPESAVRLGVLREGSAAHRASLRLEAWCYRRAWLVTGQSREIIGDVSTRFPGCRTFHLSNGADTDLFTPDRGTPDARAKLGAPGVCVALYAGLHGLAQRLDQVLAAAELLTSGLRIVLVGDGPERERLRAEAASRRLTRIQFLPPVPRSEMPAVLASADIALVPLGFELPGAVPSKLYEAMATGRPVILVAGGEAAAIVRACDAGLVVDPGDVVGLAAALDRLEGDAELRARLGRNGREAARRRFDRAAIGAGFADYLVAALAEPNAAVTRTDPSHGPSR